MMLLHKITIWWNNRTISAKTSISQILLVLVPVICCLVLFFNQLQTDDINANANKCYSLCRYTLDSMENTIRQIEAASNTLAKSSDVQDFLAVYNRSMSIKKYYEDAVHPYIANIHMVHASLTKTTLYATENSSLFAYRYLGKWPKDSGLQTDLQPELKYGVWVSQQIPGTGAAVAYYQGIYDSRKMVGVLEVKLDNSLITNTMNDMSNMLMGSTYIVSPSNDLLFMSGADAGGQTADIPLYAATLSEGVHRISDSTLCYILSSENLSIKFAVLQPVLKGLSLNSQNLTILILTLAVALVSIAVSILMMYRGITRRLIQLSSHMKNIDSMDLQPIEDVAGNDEIGKLAHSYNGMLDRIGQLAKSAQKAELLREQAAYRSLQAQIQPHFLYNTLETIRMMAESNDDEPVADMLFSFGRLLRHSISDNKQATTLENELNNLGNYLKLQQLRMITWLTYSIDVQTDLVKSFECPKFLLQPLVENSIQHGVQKGYGQDNRMCHIRIAVTEESGGVQVTIEDNGLGMSSEKLAEVQSALRTGEPIRQTQSGIGISNVQSRLKLFYGSSASMRIDSKEGEGTTCTLYLTSVHDQSKT